MRMPFKRSLALLLAIVSVTMVAPIAAYAEKETADVSMETALVAAKGLIGIDDDVFTEFSYSSSYSNFETREGLIWSFSWSDLKNSYIYADVTAEGILLHFRKFSYTEKSFGFAVLSKAAATKIADEFIKEASPDTYSFYKAPSDISTNIHGKEFSLSYTAEVNGYAFEAAQISVSVNKFTGEVTGYSTRNIDPGNFKVESAAGLISESAAIAAYADKIGLSLEYRSNYDFDKGEITVFPVYLFNSDSDRYISARTGDIITYQYDSGRGVEEHAMGGRSEAEAPAAAPAADSEAGGRQSNITPAEREAIEQVAKFLSSEEALKNMLNASDLSNLDVGIFTEQYISLNRHYMERNRYFYEIYMGRYLDWDERGNEISSIYGRVDAATGRVLGFSIHHNGIGLARNEKDVLSIEQARAAVEAFLKKIAPEEFAKSKLEDFRSPIMPEPLVVRGNAHYYYTRYENDVPYRDNGISVTFNHDTGKITGFGLNWSENVTFPSVASAISPQQALTAYAGQNGSIIKYVTTGEGNAAIVYDFRSVGLICPFTGKALDYTGELWSAGKATPAYGDVTGHWSEAVVMKLLENEVFLWGGPFEPERVMTELDFLQYIMLIEPSSFASRDPFEYLAGRGVKIEASADKNLTRQVAARIIVEYLGYGMLAEQSEWFVYPFSDNVADDYKGYITICYMLGIINGNNGRFNAAGNVMRSHAASMLHNLIISQS